MQSKTTEDFEYVSDEEQKEIESRKEFQEAVKDLEEGRGENFITIKKSLFELLND